MNTNIIVEIPDISLVTSEQDLVEDKPLSLRWKLHYKSLDLETFIYV